MKGVLSVGLHLDLHLNDWVPWRPPISLSTHFLSSRLTEEEQIEDKKCEVLVRVCVCARVRGVSVCVLVCGLQ